MNLENMLNERGQAQQATYVSTYMRNPQTQKSVSVVARGWGGGGMWKVAFWGGENVLELDSGDSQHCECSESHLTVHAKMAKW